MLFGFVSENLQVRGGVKLVGGGWGGGQISECCLTLISFIMLYHFYLLASFKIHAHIRDIAKEGWTTPLSKVKYLWCGLKNVLKPPPLFNYFSPPFQVGS